METVVASALSDGIIADPFATYCLATIPHDWHTIAYSAL